MIYLDLDGVLVDLVSGLAMHLGVPVPTVFPKGHDLNAAFGRDDIFDNVDRKFWAGLRPTVDIMQTLQFVMSLKEPITILTAVPSFASKLGADCLKGKLDWLVKWRIRFPVILTAYPKELLADSESTLIDDHDHNTREFQLAGGKAITVPRPWNSEKQSLSEVYEKFLLTRTTKPDMREVQEGARKSSDSCCE